MDYKIELFEKFNDNRGQLVVFLRNRNLSRKQKEFGQIYFVTFEKKGMVRGNHYHKKWREWFGLITGRIEVLLKDVKTGKEKRMIMNADSNRYVRLEIGPNIAHAFKNITTKASILNYTDKEWNPKDTFPMMILE